MAVWAQAYFLNTNSMILFMLIEYHNLAMFLMSNILVFLLSMLLFMLSGAEINSWPWKEDNKTMEILWTIFPIYWLIMLAVPSLGNLYRMDLSKCEYEVLFKAIGNQWYWSYEYNMSGISSEISNYLNSEELGMEDGGYYLSLGSKEVYGEKFWGNKDLSEANSLLGVVMKENYMSFSYNGGVSFVSYMEDLSGLELGEYRLLEVDNRVICPGLMDVRVNITSSDVIHSWTMPAVGVKVDAVPGRLNCATFKTLEYGVFYGQCSEMCGAKHSFMPICLEAIPFNWFCLWMKEFQAGM